MKVPNEDLMESVLDPLNLELAWKAVKGNRGSAGIDGISTDEFIEKFSPHREVVLRKLREDKYKPSPVKRVYIPKEKNSKRALGIPTVQDRVIQQAISQVIGEMFETRFSDHSYGFRPGRSSHDAVMAAQGYIAEGKDWVVDIDLKSFFDEVNHDLLMRKVSEVVHDKRVLHLIGKYLRSGVYEDGEVTATRKGVPQGGPLSPLLSNIYLDMLDKELEKRGHCFCRYADDCNIYVGSEKSARSVYASIVNWIHKHLKIPVNEDKSDIGRPWERSFLGYIRTDTGKLKPSPKSLDKFMDKVRECFNARKNGKSIDLRDYWKSYVRGWCNYYCLANAPYWREDLSRWTRRHMRKCFWQRWHKAKGRRRKLLKLGVPVYRLNCINLWGSAWRCAKHPLMHMALNNKILVKYGFLTPSDFAPST